MDIIREKNPRRIARRRIIYGLLGVATVAIVTLGLSQLEPAAPTVEQETLWIDTVERGTMIRQVRGLGTLVPEQIWWIPATTESRVERVLVQPGSMVTAQTVLLELSDPELEQRAIEAEYQLKGAEAEYRNLRVKLESEKLESQATLATVRAEFEQAKAHSDIDRALGERNLNTGLERTISSSRAGETSERYALQQKRSKIAIESARAQLAVQQARVEQYRAALALMRSKVESLHVRAGIDGVLQQLPVQVGQRVTLGMTLAKVAQPSRLKAELKIPETQAKDVVIGQRVAVDTRNGIVEGHVSRIDPAVLAGTVTVDVTLDGELPRGARPDLSVDGTIELERLEDILHLGRPNQGEEQGTARLFRVDRSGHMATRTEVRLGRSSVNTIEILGGLSEGDRVILSDMSRWDDVDRVELK
jgi:HlyD family secretion protein